ncbi:hypothetical protein IGI04_002187 [Brassica rapa subsp. trilocularis]|uniref:Uncharacterized protein n=1 Tax=Brassica rapa subsp. trilocularis TaxID=1813537 RepID=A0ABQ7NUV0_BRACM|nr:hypothetical protein IGI04_002187 [Brassica rapa subsp. trilocularis]
MKGSKKRVVSKPSSSRTIVKANPNDNKSVTIEPPIVSSYNDQIRPLLDTTRKIIVSETCRRWITSLHKAHRITGPSPASLTSLVGLAAKGVGSTPEYF